MTEQEQIDRVFDDLKACFKKKQEEYCGETQDVFRNFNQAGELQSETPEQTLLGFVSKQIVSLFDAKKHHPDRLADFKFTDEKAGDIAVYMIILMAMVRSKQLPEPPTVEVIKKKRGLK